MARQATPNSIETSVLFKSARRCVLCFHINHDFSEQHGQIAHLDQDPSNYKEDNLAFLCVKHHTLYDSKTSQHKNYTINEVKKARAELYLEIEKQKKLLADANTPSSSIRRDRDIQNLKNALAEINWPIFDNHLDGLPKVVSPKIFHFWEGFNAAVGSSLFHIYDETLASKLQTFRNLWSETVAHGIHYRDAPSGLYIFDNPNHRPFDDIQEKAWQHIEKCSRQLVEAKNDLLQSIRRDYVEIDIDALSQAAWNDYVSYQSKE